MKELGFTRIGFILAAAGSAVGLGNIWKFPYITGEYGGGAFVLVYLLTLLIIGLPLLIGEMVIGSMGRKEPVSSFEDIAPIGKKGWKFAGFSLLTGFLILTFYNVVIGWILYYIYLTLTSLPTTVSEAESVFMGMLTTDASTQLLYYTVTCLIIAFIIIKGVNKGIQKASMVLMPSLIVMLLIMFFYATSLDTFGKAVEFMFAADFSKLTPKAILVSVGHAFFTLSVGMAVIITYASFSNKNTNILKSSLWIILLDTGIALIAGLMMFTFLFNDGLDAGKGPGLVFISMPAVFYSFGSLGVVFSLLFFISLAFAGITSAMSILEPSVAYANQRLGWNRKKATIIIALIAYALGLLALLSNVKGFEFLSFGEKNIFDTLDFLTSSILLPTGGFLVAIFLGYVVDKKRVKEFVVSKGIDGNVFNIWYATVKYIAPIALIVVLLNMLGFI